MNIYSFLEKYKKETIFNKIFDKKVIKITVILGALLFAAISLIFYYFINFNIILKFILAIIIWVAIIIIVENLCVNYKIKKILNLNKNFVFLKKKIYKKAIQQQEIKIIENILNDLKMNNMTSREALVNYLESQLAFYPKNDIVSLVISISLSIFSFFLNDKIFEGISISFKISALLLIVLIIWITLAILSWINRHAIEKETSKGKYENYKNLIYYISEININKSKIRKKNE